MSDCIRVILRYIRVKLGYIAVILGLYRGYTGITEKKLEATIVCWGKFAAADLINPSTWTLHAERWPLGFGSRNVWDFLSKGGP